MRITSCRICSFPLKPILSLGTMPIVNYFPSKEELLRHNKKYPLTLGLCKQCGLIQLDEIISPDKLFKTYHYASSTSAPLKAHLERLAEHVRRKFRLRRGSFVMDIGCNDGVLLEYLQKRGIHTLGIDPARNILEKLQKKGLDVRIEFFNKKNAQKVLHSYGKADVIFATNTLAQIVDLHDFIEGVEILLSKDGVFIAEVGYAFDMIRKKTFDAVYHEHYSYFFLLPLLYLFEMHGLKIYDAEHISSHGGSLRIYATHALNSKYKATGRLRRLVARERKMNIKREKIYFEFAKSMENFKKNLQTLLHSIKKKNKTIIGWGAPAKGVILLNYCNINPSIIDFVVDSTPYKQYRYIPGAEIPVYPEEKLMKSAPPDYLFFLAWTYKDELFKKALPYCEKGSKIIIPFPKIKII